MSRTKDTHTVNRVMRLSDEDWEDLGAAARDLGMSRTEVVRALVEWWLRRRGVKYPPRPPRIEQS